MALFVAGTASLCSAGDDMEPAAADSLLQEVLSRVDRALRSPDPVRVRPLLNASAAAAGTSTDDLCRHLRRRLEQLDSLRREGADDRERVLDLRGELSPNQARRLVDHLLRGLRSILDSEDEYVLDTSLRWAAREARVPAREALPFVGRLVGSLLAAKQQDSTAAPVGVVVSGWTERYEYKLEPLLLYLDTESEEEAREAVRDLQRFIVPRLVRRLQATPGIAWALRQRDLTALVEPAYEVHLRVRSLRFAGTTNNLLPCIDLGLRVLDTGTERPAFSADIDHCTELHGSSSSRRLEGFFDEVADLVATGLDPFFTSHR